MKKKKEELELALQGYINPHQRLMIKTILSHIEFLTEQHRKKATFILKSRTCYFKYQSFSCIFQKDFEIHINKKPCKRNIERIEIR